MAELATRMLRESLQALDATDARHAAAVAARDVELDDNFAGSLRHLATYVLENTRHLGQVFRSCWC